MGKGANRLALQTRILVPGLSAVVADPQASIRAVEFPGRRIDQQRIPGIDKDVVDHQVVGSSPALPIDARMRPHRPGFIDPTVRRAQVQMIGLTLDGRDRTGIPAIGAHRAPRYWACRFGKKKASNLTTGRRCGTARLVKKFRRVRNQDIPGRGSTREQRKEADRIIPANLNWNQGGFISIHSQRVADFLDRRRHKGSGLKGGVPLMICGTPAWWTYLDPAAWR